MNPIERGMLAKRDLAATIKLNALKPKFEKIEKPVDDPSDYKIVDARNDIPDIAANTNENKSHSQLYNKISAIADPQNAEFILEALKSKLSPNDITFLLSTWQQVLSGLKSTFGTGSSKDLVVDFIIEKTYDLQLKTSKSFSKHKSTVEKNNNTIVAKIDVTNQLIQAVTAFVDKTLAETDAEGRQKIRWNDDFEFETIQYRVRTANIYTPAVSKQRLYRQKQNAANDAIEDIYDSIKQTGLSNANFINTLNNADDRTKLKEFLQTNQDVAGRGLKKGKSKLQIKRPLLYHSQKKKTIYTKL